MHTDENGNQHPDPSDPWNSANRAHMAFCKRCNPCADESLKELLYKVWAAGCLKGLATNPGWEEAALESNPYRDSL